MISGKITAQLRLIRRLPHLVWTCYKSLPRKKQEKEKKRESLVILGMLIDIHGVSSLASIFKMAGLLSTA